MKITSQQLRQLIREAVARDDSNELLDDDLEMLIDSLCEKNCII